jgi:hypothetical protein
MSTRKSIVTTASALILSVLLVGSLTACKGINITSTTKAGATTATTKAGAAATTTKAGAATTAAATTTKAGAATTAAATTTKAGAATTAATTKAGAATTAATTTAKPGATTTLAGGLAWPTDKMGDLPKINARLDSVIQADKGYMLGFSSLALADANKYVASLKALGYAPTLEMSAADSIIFYGLNTKGNSVYFIYAVKDFTGGITFIPKA